MKRFLFILIMTSLLISISGCKKNELNKDILLKIDYSVDDISEIKVTKDTDTKIITKRAEIESVLSFINNLNIKSVGNDDETKGWIYYINLSIKEKGSDKNIPLYFQKDYVKYNKMIYASDGSVIKKLDNLFYGLNEN